MAHTISTALQNALDNYERYGAILFTFEFGTGTYGLWTGPGEIPYNGLTYRSGGSVLEISDIELNNDGSVAEFTLALGTQPDKGLTADILQTFYDEDWHMRPITVQMAQCDPDTRLPIGVITILRGQVLQAPYKRGKKNDRIEGRIVSTTIHMSESGGKYRNDSTQKQIDPTDTSLVNIGTLGGFTTRELKWGQQ
jgi:hypothetical protein